MTSAAIAGLAGALHVFAACAPAGHPIVTEVYYDAPGDDTGWEFVELWNPLAHDVALAGLVLEAGDGAAPGRWTVRWTAAARDTVRAHARFVVGGAHVSPPPDALVTLELQNGPDALRARWPDGAAEVVGWGALAYAEYACGAPATDAPSGQSLARVPDDADLGSNALDFRPAEPSPARPNQPGVDLSWLRESLALSPASPAPGEAVRVSGAIAHRGSQPLAAGAATLTLAGDALAESVQVALAAVAPGETLRVALAAAAGAAGRRELRAGVRAPGDANPGNDADTLRVRVGPGPLELTEIQFHPAAGEGEWVEVRNRSGASLDLASFTFSDRAEGRARVTDEVVLAPDSLALLAQFPAALLGVFPGIDPARVAALSAWPSLNNTDAADGFADILTLREADGLPADRVAYSAAGVPAGASLEKDGGAWAASTAPNGTPLSQPRREAAAAASFLVSPRRVTLAAPEVVMTWRLPWSAARVTVELYDLAGHRVTRLLDAETSAASGTRHVRLEGAAPGVYVAVLRARGTRGTLTRSVPLRIAGAAS